MKKAFFVDFFKSRNVSVRLSASQALTNVSVKLAFFYSKLCNTLTVNFMLTLLIPFVWFTRCSTMLCCTSPSVWTGQIAMSPATFSQSQSYTRVSMMCCNSFTSLVRNTSTAKKIVSECKLMWMSLFKTLNKVI